MNSTTKPKSLQLSSKRRLDTRRLAYGKPLLTRFGEVRSVTLGPSTGSFESGRGPGFNENG